MNRLEFAQLAAQQIIVLDGATGTELAKRGLTAGGCPEAWILDHPEAILDLQSLYVKAGTQIIYAPTFGVNRHKLANFGLQDHVADMNRRLAALTFQAAAGKAHVFGDLAPTGLMVEPCEGGAPFEEVVTIYKEQVRALLDTGIDGFAIETMLDIQEARAALLAVRELAPDYPAICTMTFEKDGRTLTGTTPEAAVVTLQSLGADAVGCNCSAGPEDMVRIITAMQTVARVPLVAKPNAGLPHIINGKTVFSMDAATFAGHVPALISAGATFIGGCCGTTPEHIRLAAEVAINTAPPKRRADAPNCLSSARTVVAVTPDSPAAIIGERINPTGKKALQAELRHNDFSLLRTYAREQEQNGAAILDVNLGLPDSDELTLMKRAVALLTADTSLPLCIDTTRPDVAEAALRLYPGRAIFNSISAEANRLEQVLPVAAKYGAMIIILPLDDNGIPMSLTQRQAIVQKVYEQAANYGYTKADVAVDGLVMTASANPEAPVLTLDLIAWAARDFGVNTVCGLSNVSFGLPRRDLLNRAFLGLAIARGLNLAIANPMMHDIMETINAANVLLGHDAQAAHYITAYANTAAPVQTSAPVATPSATAQPQVTAVPASLNDRIATSILNGDDDSAVKFVQEALSQNTPAAKLVDKVLIPAITTVGDRYEQKQIFLPQLLASAKAMRKAMAVLMPLLKQDTATDVARTPFILATVQGDIHDIGKNIVAMMLSNYGFEVIDLGKDVPADAILDAAVKHNASLIGLSALMTTTMIRMKDVIDRARERGLTNLKFIIGGAVVDQQYADSIGAAYASDAMATVRLAQQFSQTP